MRAFAVLVLTIGVFSVLGPEADGTAKYACNGLLAFASNRSENASPQIYSISLDGRRTNVSHSPLAANTDPRPSPNGAELAYWRGGSLVVSATDGSNPRRMVPPQGTFAISTTVTWAPKSALLAAAASDATSGQQLVVVFDAATGGATTVGPGWDPQWSPDGSTIAFVGDAPGGVQTVFVALPDGSDKRPIGIGNAPVWSPDGTRLLIGEGSFPIDGAAPVYTPVAGLAWTPDGSRIVGFGPGGLVSVAADGTDLRLIAEDARVGREVLSPDGQRVLVERTDGHVVVLALDGHVLRDLGPWPPPPMTFWDPRWSPDGSKVLLWSGGRVIVADVNTGETRSLVGSPAESPAQPVWSADGSSVLVAIGDASGNTDIYVARPDGSRVRPVFTDLAPEGGPVWSPNGKQLAFIRYGSLPSLIIADLRGHARVLLRRAGLASPGSGPPAWSPDGKAIAVASSTGILLVDVRTHAVRRRAGNQGSIFPAWSPDGAIAYTDGVEDSFVWIVGKRSTWKVPVGHFDVSDWGDVAGIAANLAWSPDGSKLAFTRWGGDGGTGFSFTVVDSIRIIDQRTRKTRSVPTDSWGFGWSPDGRYFIQGGFDAKITTTDGRPVATLAHLRALHPSWQPLCKPRNATP
jgi:TolB protein